MQHHFSHNGLKKGASYGHIATDGGHDDFLITKKLVVLVMVHIVTMIQSSEYGTI